METHQRKQRKRTRVTTKSGSKAGSSGEEDEETDDQVTLEHGTKSRAQFILKPAHTND